ncbi:asparagine synthase-related protein [Streptomyces pinistramenti]|uniref:asparagine synthase-related protein n=1 Tax=Streptomyces pinistramenti TaxID=2884812 RepID=UPI001D08A607|nr:asparagine synthase-related protein [Streptomyces pinistramenti]MCB5907694.1 asparagine synthase [Streptomyces pinistramenti]
MVPHASGRPWLAGSWAPEDLVVAEAGRVRVAVFGLSAITPERLAALISPVRGLPDVDRVARRLPGSAHVVASVHGQVRFQGTVTGTRCVFAACVDEVPVAADRADVLARMTGAEPDEELLAAGVTHGMFFAPLSERSWWRGVHQVAADSYLAIPGNGAARTVRWWNPPEPDVPLAQGAAQVRESLREAVAQRQTHQGRLSADLSGGMDSTSLCFLAAEHHPDLLTFRWNGGSAINDDPRYATQAERSLAHAEHLTVPETDAPPVFAPPYSLPDTEAPRALTRGMNAIRSEIRLLVEHGATRHMAGHGADELFTGSAAYLHTLFRRSPFAALRQLRAHRALYRWPLASSLSGLLRGEDLGAWWRRCADGLGRPAPPSPAPALDWGVQVPATPWATGDAVKTTQTIFYGVADQVAPLAQDRGQHEALTALRSAGPALRLLGREFAAEGLRLELPYLDDRVAEAALSIVPHERYTPWRYKPVLATAMRGLVPDVILDRTTKGDCEESVDRALQEHIPDLLELFTDSLLARRGLIDPARLRTTLLTPPRSGDVWSAQLEATLGAELWLREIAARTTTSAPAGPARDDSHRLHRVPDPEERS